MDVAILLLYSEAHIDFIHGALYQFILCILVWL